MLLFAPRQRDASETRTPLTPDVVRKLVADGLHVTIEPGLGEASFLSDTKYTEAGATLAHEGHRAWEDADVVITLGPPAAEHVRRMQESAVLIGSVAPTQEHDVVRAAAERAVSLVSLEFVPRITRAQAMDVLSSQANLAGYKAVLLGADHCPKLMPMMITAAGTLAPGRVFVVGVGVAGLQAIATGKRLGAIVEAYDVRPATKEQVQSLGARFVELPGAGGGEAAGGYAKEQTDEERQKQAELMAKHVTGADVVVTTAAVFGKAPPMLIPADVVRRMQPGAVIVDLGASAAHGRGNCELTQPGEVITVATEAGGGGTVTLVGTLNLPGLLPVHASQVYANNVHALLKTMIHRDKDEAGDLQEPFARLNLDDEVHVGALIVHKGQVLNELVRGTLEPA